ncbi:hypothetical protein A9Q87_03040 [Flavobacteriales bacterium 34_180_T64]|nr:hypothetical protein A9Q87_03040 [Flavobacteriales bacterium 34_180_T64]
MKKITYLIVAVLFVCTNSNAQITLEGDDDFGRLEDLTYHPMIQNRLFAVTLKSHIVVSNDNGITWDFFYSFPDENARIQQLDLLGNDSLSFFVTQVFPENNVYVLDINTATITKEYLGPVTSNATREWVKNYDIYEADSDVIIINEAYNIGGSVHYIVYYSTDGGGVWQAVYNGDLNNSISVNNVAINPDNPDNFYISRGAGPTEEDGGVLVSFDSGVNFVEGLVDIELNAFKFHPSNSNIMYLGTGWGGNSNVYKSVDGGVNWTAEPITWDNSGPLKQVNYIAINPTNSDYMIVLGGDETAITSDGGVSWTTNVYDIDLLSDLYVYGMKASYNPFNAEEVKIATDRYPVNSIDGGATLIQMENPFFLSEFVSYDHSDGGHLYYGLLQGIVHKDMTTGIHTVNQETPLGTFTINPKTFFPDQYVTGRSYMRRASGTTANLLLLENHGANLTGALFVNFTSNLIDVETDPNDTDDIWVSFDDGTTRLFNTSINTSYVDIALPVANPDPTSSLILHFTTYINPENSNHVMIGQGGRIYESLDRGSTWVEKSAGIDLFLNADLDIVYDIEQNPFSPDEFVASTSQGIFESIDFGDNWTKVYEGEYLRKIGYSTTDSDTIIASVYSSQTTESHLVYSIDNGSTWTVIPPSVLEYVGSGSMTYQFESGFVHVYVSTYDSGVVKYSIDLNNLSVSDYTLEQNMLIFPNPASSSFSVVLNEMTGLESIIIFDVTGKKVLETQSQENINIQNLSQGVYIVRMKDANGTIYIKRLVKK